MSILVKIFAVALTLSQVTTRPDVKTQFDPVRDQPEAMQLLRDGCGHMLKVFDLENINIDELITIAMNDPQAVTSESKAFRGINFDDMALAYREICKGESAATSAINTRFPWLDMGEVLAFYNKAVTDLPDVTKLKGQKLRGLNVVLDGDGRRYADDYKPGQRRLSVPLSQIPEHVQQAFISVEDKRFYSHKGIDEHGLIRAFVGNLAQPGRPQGGSTITQQVVKNLLVGDDVSYERKIREMIVATRLERVLSKHEILELYLNSIYLGRSAWGVEMAAHRYFGKSADQLTLGEGALLAGLTKGPSYFSPDWHPDRAQARYEYVLTRMQEDGAISADQMRQASAAVPHMAAFARAGLDSGLYFMDQLRREAKAVADVDLTTGGSYTIHSTVNPALQRAVETALQDGLARYEMNYGRARFRGPETNLAKTVQRLEATTAKGGATMPAWQRALTHAHLMLYDVHWTPAIVTEVPGRKGGLRVGLADGRTVPLSVRFGRAEAALKLYDVGYVKLIEGPNKTPVRAEFRVPPMVQGAAIVLENKTGKILAVTGGFSYPLSQLNRATQAQRQPGSAIKPLTYLTALQSGLQPNALIPDEPITLPPIGGGQEKDYWTPKNYEGGSMGILTLRRALENSRNLVTARLLDGGIDKNPAVSLKRVCDVALEARIYDECIPYYPFVLGAQPVKPIDLAGFYATVANEGARPAPYAMESIERDGQVIYQHPNSPPVQLQSVDRVAFYQLKTILQGVVARGTAAAAADLSPYIGGKTGTSEDENDAWFAGFTNDITIVVWVGYDNASGTRRTLGGGSTGAGVALPIFETIIKAAWANGIPKAALAPPSAEAEQFIADLPIDLGSGERLRKGGRGAFVEHFRLDDRGALVERKTRLVGSEDEGEAPIRKHRPTRLADHDNRHRAGHARDHRRHAAAHSHAQNISTRCFLFFCNTAAASSGMW
jgi:membrane carboxypeptidase/penicillin-binding protein